MLCGGVLEAQELDLTELELPAGFMDRWTSVPRALAFGPDLVYFLGMGLDGRPLIVAAGLTEQAQEAVHRAFVLYGIQTVADVFRITEVDG